MEQNTFNKINSIHYISEEDRVKELLNFLETKYEKIQPKVYPQQAFQRGTST